MTWPLPEPRQSCHDISGAEDIFIFFGRTLATSPRLRDSIRDLHLSSHGSRCRQEGGDLTPLLQTLSQVLLHLPRIQSLALLAWGTTSFHSLTDVRPPATIYPIEELVLSCAFDAVPTFLSTFQHISRLTISCPGGPSMGEVHIPRINIPVHSIRFLCWDAPALLLLQSIVDVQTVRSLQLSHALRVAEPDLGSLIQAMPSLEALRYDCVDSTTAPFDTSGCLRLRSLTVGGRLLALAIVPRERKERAKGKPDAHADAQTPHIEYSGRHNDEDAEEHRNANGAGTGEDEDEHSIEGGGIGYSDWDSILRDLRILVTDFIEEITILLNVDEAFTSEDLSKPDNAEDIARALRKAFSLLDWDGLRTVVRGRPGLRGLRFHVDYRGFIEPEECGEALRKALPRYLPEDMVAKTIVDACKGSVLSLATPLG